MQQKLTLTNFFHRHWIESLKFLHWTLFISSKNSPALQEFSLNVIYKIRIYLNLALPITWNEEKPRSTLVQLSVFFVKIWSYAKRHVWFQLQFIIAEAAFPLHAVVARVIIDSNLVCILEHAHNRFFFSFFLSVIITSNQNFQSQQVHST